MTGRRALILTAGCLLFFAAGAGAVIGFGCAWCDGEACS